MGRSFGSSFAGLVAITASLFSMSTSADFVTPYCSTQNTANTNAFFWTWQSNGKCTDHCNAQGTYAFAVIKYTDCWCSNYIPASQTDTSQCQVDCPGYKTEKCGDKDKGLYIYVQLAGSPSGTQGGSQPTSAVASSAAPVPSSTEEPPSSEAPTSTKPSTTLQTVPAAPTTPSTTTTSSTTEDSPMTVPKAVPTVVTESGVVITRTVVIIPSSASEDTGSSHGGSNTGAIVGGAVGGVIGLLAIVGGVLFMLWRRRKQRQQEEDGTGSGSGGITRNVSTMSKAGLLGTTREKNGQYPSPIVTNFGSQRSRHDNESISPMTASERRYSQPITVDSRLNPRAVLAFHGNASRESIGTIDDSRDYGRQLNVVNPDLTHRD